MPNPLQLTLFGSPEVRRHGQPVTGFRTSKAQALLYYLAVTGRPHTRATLAGLFWGDQPEDAARASLSKCLSNLRDLLGDAVLIERQTVALNRDYPYDLDTEHFATAVGQPPTVATSPALQAALALYRGDLLEGFYVREAPDFEQWLLVQRAHYREVVINGLQALVGFHEQQGDLSSAITYTRRLLTLEPWREEAHRQLMTLLARSGQRAAALAQFEMCRRVLAEELAVEPDAETLALVETIRAGDFDKIYPGGVTRQQGFAVNAQQNSDKVHLEPPVTTLPTHPINNLPIPTTPLIGRERELAELSEMIGNPHCRLITIMGGGGMGKTRLALAAATAQANNFRHGAAFVSLTAISEPTFMAHAILQALEQPLQGSQNPQTQLLSYLRDKALLLVLDNYEQLLPDVALLIALLEHAAEVKLLVTSRERLALQAEQLFSIEGLNYPSLAANDAVEEFTACQLFLQRARQIKRGFVLNSETRTAIARICAACEGLPLALELAAGSLRTQSVLWIAEAVAANQPLPSIRLRDLPARHTSIQAVFEHSWRLLTAQEQAVLTRLSVFRAGFTLAAAEKVAEANLETITVLLDKSLVRQQSAERFDLHELLRQFAAEKLKECCEKTTTQQRHLDYFLALVEEAALHLRSADQAQWLDQLAIEQDNLRTALAWSLNEKQKERGARLGIALRRFWYIRGFYAEGWQWLEQLLVLVGDTAWRADLLYSQGTLARRSKESAIAADCFAQSLALYRQQEDQRGIASALRSLGFVHYYQGDHEAARPFFEEALSLFRRLGDQEGIAVTLDNLGYIAKTPEETRGLHQESLALRRHSGNLRGITVSLAGLAFEAIGQTDYAVARAYMEESFQINEKLGDQDGMATSFYILAIIAYAEHDYSVAQELFEKSVKLCQATDNRAGQAAPLLGLGAVALKRSECEVARVLFTQVLSSKQDHSPYQLADLLGYFAVAAVMQGEARRGLILLSAATALNISLSNKFPPFEQADFAAAETTARQQLGYEAAAQAWAAGHSMTLTEALDYALQQTIVTHTTTSRNTLIMTLKMKKPIRIHHYGSLELLRYEEDVPRPPVGRADVLIRVQAAAVNPLDWKIRAGIYPLEPPHTFPWTPGFDVAGIIEEVGADVQNFTIGNAVYGSPDGGGYAEYAVVPANEVAHKPHSIDWVQAAAMPIAGLTAWQGLFDIAALQADQTVLIHGAAGGIGSVAVQLAKWRGAHVIGTASAHNLAFLRQLGADEVLDYNTTPFEEVLKEVDLVYDTVGGETLQRSWIVLKPGGMLLSIVDQPSPEMAAAYGVQACLGILQPPHDGQLTELARLVDAGQLKPIVSAVLPIQDAPQAHRLIEGRHVRGKIVLQVAVA